MMTREEFQAGLDRWGARLEDWPQEVQAEAAQLAEADRDTAIALSEARTLAALLDRVPTPSPSAALIGRIMAEAGPRPQGMGRWLKSVWAQGAALATAGAMGLMVGLVEAAEVRGEEDLFVLEEYEISSSLESWFGEGGE